MGLSCNSLRSAYAAMRPLWHLHSHARTSVIPCTGSANAHHACVRLIVLLGNTKVTPRENAWKIELKNPKKTLDKQKLCFYDFLRDVFAARFSGERRTGVRCLLGISRSQVSGCKSSGSGTRAAGPPITRFFPNDWVFPKTGCRCL